MNEQLKTELLNTYNTPMYVFDTGVLRKRVEYLKKMLPSGTGICYAVKANTFISAEISDLVDRYEVCSPGEFSICENEKLDIRKLVISGVYKTPSFIEGIVANKKQVACITVESLAQFELLKNLSVKYNTVIPVLLRLTSGSQFGINEDETEGIIKDRAVYPLIDIRGIQYFSGTQKTSVKRLKRELTHIDEFITALYESTGYKPEELEFGPGFPVSYFEDDTFDEETYLNEFKDLLTSIQYDGKIMLELGRSIAASCGSYYTRVVDTKTNKKENYAITDGGINQLVYFGQSMAMRHPFYELWPYRDGEQKPWNVCGSLCSVNDILVKQLPLCDLKTGDVLIFKNTGAYCMTEGISLFLSRSLPCVILTGEDGSHRLIRDAFDTYILNQPK